MELIIPVASELDYTVGSPVYVTSAWVTGASYTAGDLVRYQVGSVWYDYRANFSHTSSSTNAPVWIDGKWAGTYWTLLGPAATSSGYTYTTNVRLSTFPSWVSGQAVLADAVVFDALDKRDYIATIAIAAGDNTLRPSQCLASTNEIVRARWVELGAANAWAAIDQQSNTYLASVDANGAIINGYFDVNFDTNAPVDRIGIIGLSQAVAQIETYLNGAHYADFFVPHNLLYSPTNQSDTANWTPTNVTLSVQGDGLTGQGTAAACGLRETTANSYHRLAYVKTIPCLPYTPINFSLSAKAVNGRHLAVRFHAINSTGAVIDSKYTHFMFNVASGTITGISSSTNFFNTTQSIEDLGSNWRRCHAFGVTPATTDAVVIHVYVSNTTTAPTATTANITYTGSASYGLDICAAQLCFGWVTRVWYDKNAADTVARSAIFVYPNKNKGTTLKARVLLYALNPNLVPSCGSVFAGQAENLGETEWGVESSYISYSRKERDETYGAVSFLKRGSARTVRATAFIDPDSRLGDSVQQAVMAADGMAAVWDFNNSASDYDRLRVYGFATNFGTVIQAQSWESVSLTVEGLVE